MKENRKHIALFFSGYSSGGVPRRMLTLADAFAARNHRVDIVVVRSRGPLRPLVSPMARLVELSERRTSLPRLSGKGRFQALASIPALSRYLRRERPDALLSAGNYVNFSAVMARAAARIRLPVAVCHNSHLSREADRKPFVRWVARHIYPWADSIIAVSNGVANDLSLSAGIPRRRVTTIYDPVVTPDLLDKARTPLEHPWFTPDRPPVVLGVGRLHDQKDFPTLLRAFARLHEMRQARLMILGEGKKAERLRELTALAVRLGVADDVALPGFVDNPFAYMARASVFVLSSAWEGFGMVLVEALACGCPVVSTDCPSGPAEILDGGAYGPLVAVGDDAALAQAILSVLETPPDPERLRARAELFSVGRSVSQYEKVLFNT